jgi:hypothetical protein
MKRRLAAVAVLALCTGMAGAQQNQWTTAVVHDGKGETVHRWASDVLKEKRMDGTVWRSSPPIVWREVPDCNRISVSPDGGSATSTLMYCPAQEKERYTLDWCLLHGETRVLHSKEKP